MTGNHRGRARTRRDAFRALPVGDRWDVYRYGLAALWAILFVVFTPAALRPVLTPTLTWLTMLAVVAGAVVAVVGRLRNEHLYLELGGVAGMVGGWGFYLILNGILVFAASPERLVQLVLVLLASSYSLERLRILFPKFLDALHAPDGEGDET